jgi:TPR repeat protein
MNDTEAAVWFRKAADQGHADAQYYLGSMFSRGLGGLPKGEAKAASWYLKAAEQENAHAEFALGLMYESGSSVPQDKTEAIKWFRRAAKHGEEMTPEKLRAMGVDI